MAVSTIPDQAQGSGTTDALTRDRVEKIVFLFRRAVEGDNTLIDAISALDHLFELSVLNKNHALVDAGEATESLWQSLDTLAEKLVQVVEGHIPENQINAAMVMAGILLTREDDGFRADRNSHISISSSQLKIVFQQFALEARGFPLLKALRAGTVPRASGNAIH